MCGGLPARLDSNQARTIKPSDPLLLDETIRYRRPMGCDATLSKIAPRRGATCGMTLSPAKSGEPTATCACLAELSWPSLVRLWVSPGVTYTTSPLAPFRFRILS